MSLKAVEMQIALPRTQEVSRIQEQVQYRQAHENQQAIDARNQADQAMRQRATDINETDKGQIRDKQEKQKKQQKNKHSADPQQDEAHEKNGRSSGYHMVDPFRGRHVDISL